ncbi:MAG: exodeoxyribonuclease VII small subunit [Proteobacteria bacterium]|nr:exodeoxyribonuclease VII small subunit [Pseudomonadota bacterium]
MTNPDQPSDQATPDFEAALAELEDLVAQMETGDMTLEASLKAFERGVALTKTCTAALKTAELKVQVLTASDELVPLDPEDVEVDDA